MPATDLHLAAKAGEMDEAEKFLGLEENKTRWARVCVFAARCCLVSRCASHTRVLCAHGRRLPHLPHPLPCCSHADFRINETDSTGWTALHWAASRGRVSAALRCACVARPRTHARRCSRGGLCWTWASASRALWGQPH